ncbi:ABC transporter permease subunit [Thermosipho atlanticus]|uniref:ABC-2 type transport system permease protein n=1 Tax=Thermosipho atlanticus DSM 15807 TaxID=1123380 RepID=A0A1M5TRJ2_9BACT|nr:ABC transporter permease subunit [Thermosipho atlanticus]SHH53288.1 ABC-2 type transport system permease protein [Thermosipho atlanticus DSM 15807]
MNLIRKEIKYTFKNLIIWSVVIILFNLMYSSFTDLIIQQNSPLTFFLEKMPETLLNALNMDISIMSKPEGLFGTEGMTFMFIFFGIFSSTLANKLFAGEYDHKTIEYLLVKPFPRRKIFLYKIFALSTNLILLFFIFSVSLLSFFKIFVRGNYSNRILISFSVYLLVTAFFFAALAVFLSLLVKNRKLTNSLSLGILFFMYFGYSISKGVKHMEFLRKISVFYYMPVIETIKNNKGFYFNSLMILLVSFFIFAISAKIFETQDIKI